MPFSSRVVCRLADGKLLKGKMAPPPPPDKMKVGRQVPTAAEALLWEQRIHKEEMVNAAAAPKFSLRNAVTFLDVPSKFKVGHVDPSKEEKSVRPFDPADNGWDPQGQDANEFRRCMKSQVAGPRDRQAYPLTRAQEHGWLQAPRGEPVDRVKEKKLRLGFGWEWKPPAEYSISTATPPPLYLGVAKPEAGGSALFAVPPPAASALSANPPPPISVLSNSPPSCVSAARASQLSASAPVSEVSTSCLSRSSSLPAILEHPADRLHRQERRLDRVMKESTRFHKLGDRGQLYDKPLGATDVTKFDDDFTKAAGVPLYKLLGSQEVTLKHPKTGVLVQKWR